MCLPMYSLKMPSALSMWQHKDTLCGFQGPLRLWTHKPQTRRLSPERVTMHWLLPSDNSRGIWCKTCKNPILYTSGCKAIRGVFSNSNNFYSCRKTNLWHWLQTITVIFSLSCHTVWIKKSLRSSGAFQLMSHRFYIKI